MSQEEKLEEAKRLYKDANADQRYVLEHLFPELKDGDEKIRKDIIWCLKHSGLKESNAINPHVTTTTKDAISWLEKQGKQKHKIQPKFKIGDIIRFKGNETLKGEVEAHEIVGYDNELYVFADGTTDLFCEQDLYELVEQKSVDKVELKFKIEKGKWYVCIKDLLDNYANKSFRKGDTYLSTQDGSLIPSNSNVPFEVVCPDTYFRDWTIQDAKDGDVLIDKSGSRECPFIFKETKPSNIKTDVPNPLTVLGYCGIGGAGFTKSSGWGDTANCTYYPATKEQRDLLFRRMKAAGYEWDADKKELKEIEQKPAWNEEDVKMIETLIAIFEVNYPDGFYKVNPIGTTNMQGIHSSEIIKWLKSLKNRHIWRPSDEQMAALSDINCTGGISYAGQGQELIDLYNDLKKLKE